MTSRSDLDLELKAQFELQYRRNIIKRLALLGRIDRDTYTQVSNALDQYEQRLVQRAKYPIGKRVRASGQLSCVAGIVPSGSIGTVTQNHDIIGVEFDNGVYFEDNEGYLIDE